MGMATQKCSSFQEMLLCGVCMHFTHTHTHTPRVNVSVTNILCPIASVLDQANSVIVLRPPVVTHGGHRFSKKERGTSDVPPCVSALLCTHWDVKMPSHSVTEGLHLLQSCPHTVSPHTLSRLLGRGEPHWSSTGESHCYYSSLGCGEVKMRFSGGLWLCMWFNLPITGKLVAFIFCSFFSS